MLVGDIGDWYNVDVHKLGLLYLKGKFSSGTEF